MKTALSCIIMKNGVQYEIVAKYNGVYAELDASERSPVEFYRLHLGKTRYFTDKTFKTMEEGVRYVRSI